MTERETTYDNYLHHCHHYSQTVCYRQIVLVYIAVCCGIKTHQYYRLLQLKKIITKHLFNNVPDRSKYINLQIPEQKLSQCRKE